MKRLFLIIGIVCLIFVLIWCCFVVKNLVLTAIHTDEFAMPEKLGITYMTAWDVLEGYKVLSYGEDEAVVYYYGEKGGERVVFQKRNGQWSYLKTTAIWSQQGTADDYFIFPYFKKPLF